MITGKLLLYTYHKPTKKGFPIKILITNGVTKKTKPISLKIYSQLKDWNEKSQEPKKSHPDYYDLLEDVLYYKSKLIKALRESRLRGWSIDKTIQYIKETEEDRENFVEYANNHITIQANLGKNAEIKQTALNSFKRFCGDNIEFSDMTTELLKRYRDWALNNGMSNNGIHTYLRKLKTIYNEAKGTTQPFKGVMTKITKTRNKHLLTSELKKIVDNDFVPAGKFSGSYHYANYFLLCFYLGGIDLIDLANLRYDKHVINGRIQFERFKGGTNERINNLIPKEAKEILRKYDCKPYLVPIHKAKDYHNFSSNYNRRVKDFFKRLGVESYVTSKSPRYTFINIAKDLELNREIIKEIVGHSKQDVHSIYEGNYSDKVRDEVHLKIISQILC